MPRGNVRWRYAIDECMYLHCTLYYTYNELTNEVRFNEVIIHRIQFPLVDAEPKPGTDPKEFLHDFVVLTAFTSMLGRKIREGLNEGRGEWESIRVEPAELAIADAQEYLADPGYFARGGAS